MYCVHITPNLDWLRALITQVLKSLLVETLSGEFRCDQLS